jgi:hypothetical protein
VEAIAGCPVIAHQGSLWADSSFDDYKSRSAIRFSPDNSWFRKLLEFTCAMVDYAADRFPVAVPQMRGPLDTLAAMRTPVQMSLDLLESPDDVTQVLAEITDLWIAVGEAVLAKIPVFEHGYVTRMGMCAPDRAITLQDDVSTLVSPDAYRRFVVPCLRKILDRFPYVDFHMHASEHHQVGNILELKKLAGIQFTLEHTLGGPPLEKMLPLARRILEEKPLLLTCLDCDSADRCLRELGPTGLFIAIATSGDDISPEIEAWTRTAASVPSRS